MSRLRRHSPLHHIERLAVFLFGLLLPVVTFALTTTPNTYNWHGSRVGGIAGAPPGTAPTRATFRVNEAGKAATYVGKSFPTSFASIGKLGRGALSGINKAVPYYNAYVLTKAAIDGAGWAIGELQGQVTEGAVPSVQVAPGGTYWTASGVSQYRFFSTKEQARKAAIEAMPLATQRQYKFNSWGEFVQANYSSYGTQYINLTYVDFSTGQEYQTTTQVYKWTNNYATPITTEAEPGRVVSDQELGEKLAAAGPETVDALLTQDGAVMRTPELVQAMNELTAALEAERGLPTSEPATPDPDFAQNPEEQAPAEDEWPGFCDWAKPVCDFIAWVKKDDEMPEPSLPIEQETVKTVAWSSGLGGGSCPAPENISINVGPMSTSVAFGYDTICTAMSYMRPVFITMAGVLAAFIVGGFRGGRNA